MSNRKTLKIRVAVLFAGSFALAATNSAAFASHFITKAKPAPATNAHVPGGGSPPCYCGPKPPPKG